MADPWDLEYQRQGIPSSYKTDPARSVRWVFDMVPYLRPVWKPATALDVGCGTGRNAAYLAEGGIRTVAIDRSANAIQQAKSQDLWEPLPVRFERHDLTDGLPVDNRSQDLVIDTFVYFHVTSDVDRAAYRAEVCRVLSDNGLFLLTMATEEDGFYSSCDVVEGSSEQSSLPVVHDPVAAVDNILPAYADLLAEVGQDLDLMATWTNRGQNVMHGNTYDRVRLSTIWQAKP